MAASKKGEGHGGRESLVQKINRGMQATRQAVHDLNEAVMHRVTRDAWHGVIDAESDAQAELKKEWDALFTAVAKCEEHIGELREAEKQGVRHKIDPCHTYQLLNYAGMAHRLLAKIELLQKQIKTYNDIIDPE